MKIRKCSRTDEKDIRALWSYCFEREDDPWFRWYFRELYRPEDVLAGEEAEKIACSLHRRPYEICVRGAKMPVDYLVGVATHPAARGKGLATELIRGAFHMARMENKGAVILMPSAASYYYPMGFSFYAHQWKNSPKTIKIHRKSLIPKSPLFCQRWELKIPNLPKVGTSSVSICFIMIY